MAETLIRVEGLYKKFVRDLKRGLVYGTTDTFRSMFGISYSTDYLRNKEFWALQDVNFELKRGDVLGLIGRNGSGKSTLLRLLTGIFPPDKGKIVMKGRIGALIAVGAGFHPHMSGRENVYLNGTLLGMDRYEIKKRFDEIVDFAEVGEFIDAPVATYSSGMRVRLGFAIAVHVEPDILLVDEVLSVGDAGFRAKSFNKIVKITESSAVVFVSHSMPQITRVCNKILLMKNGQVTDFSANLNPVIDKYFENFDIASSNMVGEGLVEVLNVKFSESILYNQKLEIEITYLFKISLLNYIVHITIVNQEQNPVAQIFSNNDSVIFDGVELNREVCLRIYSDPLKLTQGLYSVNIGFIENSINGRNLARFDNLFRFSVTGNKMSSFTPFLFNAEWQIT